MRKTSFLSFMLWLASTLAAHYALVLQAAESPATAVATSVTAGVALVAPVAVSSPEAPVLPIPEGASTGAVAVSVVGTAPSGAVVPAISAGVTGAAVSAEAETIAMPGFGAPVEAQERISIALDDVPLQDVVRMFTRISGANIIATSTNLAGKVTVNLQDVEWKPALGAILDMYNLQISEKTPASGIYSVMPKAPGAEDPLTASTIFLNYASVSNVAVLVQPLLGRGGSVSSFPNCNALVIRASPANANEIRKVITEIDLPRKQVYIEAKFLELTDTAIKDLGINWSVLQGYNVGAAGMQWSLNEERDKSQGNGATLNQSDTRTRNDAINQNVDASGKAYPDSAATPQRTVADSVNQSAAAQRSLNNNFNKTVTDIRTAVLSPADFQLTLAALKQQNGVNIISNPKIIVANEQTATIHIGQNEPNIKGTVTPGQQGQANTTTYELDPVKPYFEFGIKLDVTPVINNSSNITIAISPTLSRFVANKVAPDNNTYPIEADKTITTTFSLANGKTAAIGGLTETDDRKQEIKVPLLGDIPIIGKYLFTYNHTERLQDETIIFVTVSIANPDAIDRAEGLPEDAELVHRHMTNLHRSMGGFPGGGATTNAASAIPSAKSLDKAAAAPAR